MPLYVDGFLLPLPKRNIAAYRRLASLAAKVRRQHGALECRECVGDDLAIRGMVRFPRVIRAKTGETVMFAWIVYKSRKHRDSVNARVMKDPRILNTMKGTKPSFDFERMAYGGFRVLVDA